MKTHAIHLVTAAIAAALSFGACTNAAMLKISTPTVQARIIGDVEKDILAGGGALLLSGGGTSAAVTAMTAQELQNLPALQQALAKNPCAAVAP